LKDDQKFVQNLLSVKVEEYQKLLNEIFIERNNVLKSYGEYAKVIL